jgi:hypothetical protein
MNTQTHGDQLSGNAEFPARVEVIVQEREDLAEAGRTTINAELAEIAEPKISADFAVSALVVVISKWLLDSQACYCFSGTSVTTVYRSMGKYFLNTS